jgi:hypothetical protein
VCDKIVTGRGLLDPGLTGICRNLCEGQSAWKLRAFLRARTHKGTPPAFCPRRLHQDKTFVALCPLQFFGTTTPINQKIQEVCDTQQNRERGAPQRFDNTLQKKRISRKDYVSRHGKGRAIVCAVLMECGNKMHQYPTRKNKTSELRRTMAIQQTSANHSPRKAHDMPAAS